MGTANDWKDVALGNGTSCALKTDGTLWCWGTQLGSFAATVPAPAQLGTATSWASLSLSESHACAIESARERSRVRHAHRRHAVVLGPEPLG